MLLNRSARGLFPTLCMVGVLLLAAVAAEAQSVLVPNLIYNTVKPCRIFDTRSSIGGKLIGGTAQTFKIAGTAAGTYFTNQGGPAAAAASPTSSWGSRRPQAVVISQRSSRRAPRAI